MNPVTCANFRKYVSVKGENFENDVLFWLEVQKFKVSLYGYMYAMLYLHLAVTSMSILLVPVTKHVCKLIHMESRFESVLTQKVLSVQTKF